MENVMDTSTQIMRNTENIAALTTNIALLTEDFKREKETRKEVQENVKAVLAVVQGLSEKMLEITNLSQKIADVRESQSGIRHDINTIMNAQPLLTEKVSSNVTELAKIQQRVKTLEDRNIKQDGAALAARLIICTFWVIFGATISAFIMYHFLGYR